ncbi:MAG TPA: NUDIX hydrolase [Acidimicrobiales bacterium]|nr:NUDIX hydrolase [Acidimicrobiales bacterium]
MADVRQWVVAGGIVEGPDGLLLVQNRRRNGSLDWSTPGGVIEVHEGESVVDGLTREVEEETGIVVTEWRGPLFHVETEATGLGWHLRVEVHQAVAFHGDIRIDDPDGIVVDARFVDPSACGPHLDTCHPWVREPLAAWLADRWHEARRFRYRIDGDSMATASVTRL